MAAHHSVTAFVADAVLWSRSGDETVALRLFRSRHSGVAHDVSAAYAVVASRDDGLRAAIARGRLALPAPDRDAVIAFARALDRLRDAASHGDDTLRALIHETFGLATFAPVACETPTAIALAEPADAEPSAPVRATQPRFSASALNAYVECPRKWFYRYACGAIEDPGSSASFYGTAFHLALEWFHETFERPSPADEARMREAIPGFIERAFLVHRDDFETRVEYALQLRRAQRTARQYVTWLVERARRTPFTVIGRELPIAMQIEGFDFIGYIDRLDRDERGMVSVIDYKTGSIATSAAEYRDEVRSFSDFQLPFYYWAREAAGDRVSTLALIPLKDSLLDVRPIELEVLPFARDDGRKRDASAYGTIAVSDLERSRAKMVQICRELTDGSLSRFPVTSDPSACTYCAYATACNDRPPAAEEKFGR